MKRLLIFFLLISLSLSCLAGCNSNPADNKGIGISAEYNEDNYPKLEDGVMWQQDGALWEKLNSCYFDDLHSFKDFFSSNSSASISEFKAAYETLLSDIEFMKRAHTCFLNTYAEELSHITDIDDMRQTLDFFDDLTDAVDSIIVPVYSENLYGYQNLSEYFSSCGKRDILTSRGEVGAAYFTAIDSYAHYLTTYTCVFGGISIIYAADDLLKQFYSSDEYTYTYKLQPDSLVNIPQYELSELCGTDNLKKWCLGDNPFGATEILARCGTRTDVFYTPIESYYDRGCNYIFLYDGSQFAIKGIITGSTAQLCGDAAEGNAPSSDSVPENTVSYGGTEYAAYNEKISEYIYATTVGEDAFLEAYDGDYSSINSLIVDYYYRYGGEVVYSLFDVDGNGTPELIFSDTVNIIDIYTLDGDALVKLYKDCYFGERSRLHMLSDGRLLSEGSSGASASSCEVCKIAADGYSLTIINAYYSDELGQGTYTSEYISLSMEEYGAMLQGWLADSIFSELKWKPIA